MYINDLIDGRLASETEYDVRSHLECCVMCRNEMEAMETLTKTLRHLPVTKPSTDFEQRIYSSLPIVVQTHKRSFAAGFSVAMAASFAIWIAITPFNTEQVINQPATGNGVEIALPVGQVRPVRLAFNSPAEFSQVTLTIELPEHVHLQGHPGKRVLSWKTNLTAGRNVLTLPLISDHIGNGAVIARLNDGKKIKEFKLNMDVLQNNVNHDGSARRIV